MGTGESKRTTRLILAHALDNWAGAFSIAMTHPGQAGSDLSFMLVRNTPVREFDAFRPLVGVQTSHVQHALMLLLVPSLTTSHGREEEIEQTEDSEERFKKRYGKHSVEVGSSTPGTCP